MIESLRWNIIAGTAGLLIVFVTSWSTNPLTLSLLRGLYAGAILFAASFVFRKMLAFAIAPRPVRKQSADEADDHASKGSNIDMVTPDETEQIAHMLQQDRKQDDNEFVPLLPPKLARTEKADSELIAKAIRSTMSDDERW